MTFFVMEQLPLIPLDLIHPSLDWIGESAEEWICARALELFYTSWELAGLASDLGRGHPPFQWIPERRAVLEAELDAAILHFYGLSRSQVEWLLDTFTVLRKYEERDGGEFRTKRLVLEIYDEMASAKQNGRKYLTRLIPPPSDLALCHDKVAEAS